MITPPATYQPKLDDILGTNKERRRHLDIACSARNGPWTAARCNRLLRPLTIRLEQARKRQAEGLSQPSYGDKTLTEKDRSSTNSDANQPNPYAHQKRVADTDVYDGLFFKKRKFRHQYASRSRTNVRSAVEALEIRGNSRKDAIGSVQVPTPFIARTSRTTEPALESEENRQLGGQDSIPRRYPEGSDQNCEKYGNARGGFKVERGTNKRIGHVEDGIWIAFGDFLMRTKEPSSPRRKGARSLFSCCLRSISKSIRAETEWRKGEDPDDKTDVQSEVYNDLECLESTSGGGWSPLRIAARAHGVDMICQAIRNHQLDWTTVGKLVNCTTTQDGFLETQRIIEVFSWQVTDYAKSNGMASNFERCIGFLDDYSRYRGQFGFQMRHLSDLFMNGRYPVEWASSHQMLRLWTKVIVSLSERDQDYGDAARLTLSMFRSACGFQMTRPKGKTSTTIQENDGQALSNTISSLTTTLSASALVNHCNVNSNTVLPENSFVEKYDIGSAEWIIHCAAISVASSWEKLPRCEIYLDEASRASIRRALNLLVAELLLQVSFVSQDCDSRVFGVEECVKAIREIVSATSGDLFSEVADILPEAVCSISICCGRTIRSDGLTHLEYLVQRLTSYHHRSLQLASASFLQRLALDSSLYFTHHFNGGPPCQTLVRRVEASVRDFGPLQAEATPLKRSGGPQQRSRDGYRWEEGICEWIWATPATLTSRYVDKCDALETDTATDAQYGHAWNILEEQDDGSDGTQRESIPPRPDNSKISKLSSFKYPPTDSQRLNFCGLRKEVETNHNNADSLYDETMAEEEVGSFGVGRDSEHTMMDEKDMATMNDLEDELSVGVSAMQSKSFSDGDATSRYQKRVVREKLRARRQLQVKRLCKLTNDDESDDELCAV